MARHARTTTIQRARRRGAATVGALGAAAVVTVVAPTGAAQAAAPWAGIKVAPIGGELAQRVGDFAYGQARGQQDTEASYAKPVATLAKLIPGIAKAEIRKDVTYSEDKVNGNIRDYRDQVIEFSTIGGENGFALVRSSSVRTDGRVVKDWTQGQITEILMLEGPAKTALKLQANLSQYTEVRPGASNPGGVVGAGGNPTYPNLAGEFFGPDGERILFGTVTNAAFDLRDNSTRVINAGSYTVGGGLPGLGGVSTSFNVGSIRFDDKAIRFTAPSVSVTGTDAAGNKTTSTLSGGTYRATEDGVTVGKYDDPASTPGSPKPQLGTNPGLSVVTQEKNKPAVESGVGLNGSLDSTPSANVVVTDKNETTTIGTDSLPAAPSADRSVAPASAPAAVEPPATSTDPSLADEGTDGGATGAGTSQD